jgi:glucuronate isomerase
MFREGSDAEATKAFQKVMNGESITTEEAEIYQTKVLLSLARKYHKENVVMELHYSCTRNVNEKMFKIQGPDTGYDMIAKSNCYDEMAALFSELNKTNELPKTIVFSLDHNDFNQITTCLGTFQSDEVPGKMQLGAAWWFLDSRDGMEEQMKSLGNLGLLGNFVGMLTDSRSFLSYTRHDYFRRIACNLIGKWVEDGEYPNNEKSLKKIVEGISYNNAKRYFGI